MHLYDNGGKIVLQKTNLCNELPIKIKAEIDYAKNADDDTNVTKQNIELSSDEIKE